MLSTVEPPIVDREIVGYLEGDKNWADKRMTMVDDRTRCAARQAFRLHRRRRLARRRVQRCRHFDGACAAQIGSVPDTSLSGERVMRALDLSCSVHGETGMTSVISWTSVPRSNTS